MLQALTAFIASLPARAPGSQAMDTAAAALFDATGCGACHTPRIATADLVVPLYSDLLLHDLGPALDDGVVHGQARGRDWRTTPLWGLGARLRFLHDGRATSITAAIHAHAGEAARSASAFRALPAERQQVLLGFLTAL